MQDLIEPETDPVKKHISHVIKRNLTWYRKVIKANNLPVNILQRTTLSKLVAQREMSMETSLIRRRSFLDQVLNCALTLQELWNSLFPYDFFSVLNSDFSVPLDRFPLKARVPRLECYLTIRGGIKRIQTFSQDIISRRGRIRPG